MSEQEREQEQQQEPQGQTLYDMNGYAISVYIKDVTPESNKKYTDILFRMADNDMVYQILDIEGNLTQMGPESLIKFPTPFEYGQTAQESMDKWIRLYGDNFP